MRTSSMIGAVRTAAATVTIGAFTVFSSAAALAWEQPSQDVASASTPFETLADSFGAYKCFLRPNKDALMGFSSPSHVTEVLVKSGQRVKKGDLLVRGDDEEDAIALELQKVRAKSNSTVDRAKAQADLARVEHEKTVEAAKSNGATQQEQDRAKYSYEAAKADHETAKVEQQQQVLAVDRLKARLDRDRILAPFDGVVDFVRVDAGQQTNENDKILRVVNVSPLWIDVPSATPETLRLGTHIGDEAWVLMEVAGKPRMLKGKVIEIAPTGDASSRTRLVRLEIANPDKPDGTIGELVAGEPAWVRFTAPSEEWNAKFQALNAATPALATGASK